MNPSVNRFTLIGRDGAPGSTGPPGPPGSRDWHNVEEQVGSLVVIHSQSMDVPACPSNLRAIWNGFSLLYLEGSIKLMCIIFVS